MIFLLFSTFFLNFIIYFLESSKHLNKKNIKEKVAAFFHRHQNKVEILKAHGNRRYFKLIYLYTQVQQQHKKKFNSKAEITKKSL